ncbi:MAG: hypothetical protein H5U28_02235 [Burkholderiaceae bacterium]|nr:hypothetical protein [Burkholderiaceae bacterium]
MQTIKKNATRLWVAITVSENPIRDLIITTAFVCASIGFQIGVIAAVAIGVRGCA